MIEPKFKVKEEKTGEDYGEFDVYDE